MNYKLKEFRAKGGEIHFSNENHQHSIGSNDVRTATVTDNTQNMTKPNWARTFGIWFNGELIYSSKTYVSMRKRLNKLIDKWNLEEVKENEI